MMGSGSGYAGPTAEQLRAAAPVPAYGRRLMEVFSLRLLSRAAACGTVSVFDGKGGQVVYRRERLSSRAQDVLTGPYRCISADGSVAITLDLYDAGSQEPPFDSEEGVGEISWDVYNPSVEYDKAISQAVGTRCGPAEVTYAVLSNAVEGVVEMKLVHGEEDDVVRGRIVARSHLLEAGVVLFDGDVVRATPPATAIPLARSVLAVPLLWPLTVEVDLRAASGDEVAKGCLEFYPETDGRHLKRLVGRSGEIEVKITWWDH